MNSNNVFTLDHWGLLGTMHVYICHYFMGSVVFCVGGCLPVLLDASSAATANAETVVPHLISLCGWDDVTTSFIQIVSELDRFLQASDLPCAGAWDL